MNQSDQELIQGRIKDLWENTDFTATLFESLVGYAIIAADFDGNIIAYNEGARQIYGYDPEEIFGKQNIEVFFPRQFIEAGNFQRVIDVLLATGRFSYEGEKVRKSGQRFPAQVLFTLTKDRTGKVVGFVEIVEDLTERKQAEEELRNHRDHLEVLVQQRTAELEKTNEWLQAEIVERKRVEAELRQRAQELAEMDRRKDEFLAMLAHELRNPLAPIRNALYILGRDTGDAKQKTQARDVGERQVQHMTRLVDDLLDVSRITRNKVQLSPEPLDLVRLVRAAAQDHRATLEAVGLTLILHLPEWPVWVWGDPTRLAQVVGNLLHNSSKFTDPGGEVTIRLSADAEAHQAVLSVRDTGIGIDAELLPKVFETFIQADCTLDRSRGGLGLGLALVKGLVELHGGEARAASAGPGRGTEFTIVLPLTKKPAEALEEKIPRRNLPMKPLRILIIEDSLDTAESLRMVLEMSGHEVAEAHSGHAGVEVARQVRPEVVLSDLGLPGGMDGFAVARALRGDPLTAKSFLVALSGYGTKADQERCLAAGFDLHLTKPVEPDELERVLATRQVDAWPSTGDPP